jgi:DNA-binding transcriptional LysR family regulator
MRSATLRQLRAFSAVAHHQSFARAARQLHLTPSAVSLQIKELEQSVGLTLIGRKGRASCLTPAGEVLLADINRALAALKDAEDSVNRLHGGETGVVSVGMVSNAKYFMPGFLAQFHSMHPGVGLRVSVGNRAQLLRQIAHGDVDFAVMGQPPDDLDVRATALAPQPLGILAAPGHRLAQSRSLPAAALADCEFIVREQGSGTRAAMDRYFHQSNISPPLVMELPCNESIKQAVIANMGIAFLSLHTARLELSGKALVLLDIVGLPLIRGWHVVSLRSRPLTQAAKSLLEFINEFGNRFITRQFGDATERVNAAGPATPTTDKRQSIGMDKATVEIGEERIALGVAS